MNEVATPVGSGTPDLFPSSSPPETGPAPVPTVVLRPDSGWFDLNLRQIWQYRELLLALASRDIKLRYRQTALGAIWVIIQPLLAAGIFALIFGMIAGLDSEGVPYFVFCFAALLGWNAFNGTLNRSSSCIVGNSGLISKIYFPRLVLPLSVIFSTLLDFCVAFGMMIVLLLIFKITPTWGILLLPVWLFFLLICALGVGLIASAVMVKYRDVGHILPVASNLLLYASPVNFSLQEALSRTPKYLHFVFYVNPLSGLLEAFRWSILGVGELRPNAIAFSMIFSTVMLVGGMIAFKRKERWFADAI